MILYTLDTVKAAQIVSAAFDYATNHTASSTNNIPKKSIMSWCHS
jgi:hypothetical protein